MTWITFASIALLFAQDQRVLAPYTRPTLIAHRGASAYAPEHTLPAYRLALEQGADYVEPDLQITKDGVLVCMHDTTLERTTNARAQFPNRARTENGRSTWPVADFTLAEIRTLDAGTWKGPMWTKTQVPTFQEMIDTVRGKAGIIPETKAPEIYGKRGLDMEKLLLEILTSNQLDKPGSDPRTPVIIQSFSEASLRMLRTKHNCRLPLVYLTPSLGKETPEAHVTRVKQFADGLAPSVGAVKTHPSLVKEAHKQGMSVTVWTVRAKSKADADATRAEMKSLLLEAGVDAIFTDNPDLFPRK